MPAALGAVLPGAGALRRRSRPVPASVLCIAALPVRLPGAALLGALGIHEDHAGLPPTVLCGGGWVLRGSLGLRDRRAAQPRAVT